MASNAFRTPLIRYVSTRGRSSQSAAAAPACTRDICLSSVKLLNKSVATAVDYLSPTSRVTVAFKAGSRYEPPNELGISHVLRSAAGLSTKNASSFIIARKLAQIGASVSVSGDRENIYYTLETSQEHVTWAYEIFNNIISNQEFRPWELLDNIPRLKFDLASIPPQVLAVDLLHKAAYRRGLGNSLYVDPIKISKISSESLHHYMCNTMTPNRCCITVVAGSQECASSIADALQLPHYKKESEGTASTYSGGDLRQDTGGDLAHVAIALQGAPASSPASLALAIAAKALGSGPVTKWGADNTPLARAIGNIGPFAAAGFNVSYSDSGLFGVIMSVPKDEAVVAVKNAASVLKNPQLTDDAICAGKKALKLQVLSEGDCGTLFAESLSTQVLTTGEAKKPSAIALEIDQIPNSEVHRVTQARRTACADWWITPGTAGMRPRDLFTTSRDYRESVGVIFH
ncbi:Cytochrome b-c1 complex subunit 2, mitochondrial [Eumeta japonica]|uniref:Cytochrome b-c1 complex subunit 2, mitochondrial n=1 Tax=Eumeta variegata TaxID=151549 RepID=A0A4C1YK86_EUMVA|nr:Cytochrome b-c1 complex subunit 2, mitochondrial [Eumeta japonica]